MSATEMMAEGVVSLEEACRFTSLSRAQMYNLMTNGTLPFVQLGRRRTIPRAALVKYLSENLNVPEPVGAGT